MLRRLEAQLLTADSERILLISGSGDVLEPDFDVHAIGSGGAYALAAGRALLDTSDLDAKAIAEKSMHMQQTFVSTPTIKLFLKPFKRDWIFL